MCPLTQLFPRLALITAVLIRAACSQSIPPVRVKTLTGQAVTFPKARSLKPLILVLSFSSKGSADVGRWNRCFKAPYVSDSRVDYYELADFQGVPSLIMKMIMHGMRRSVQEPERSHFAPFFADENKWKSLVHFSSSDCASVLLANGKGAIVWQTQGPASETKAAELEAEVVSLLSAP